MATTVIQFNPRWYFRPYFIVTDAMVQSLLRGGVCGAARDCDDSREAGCRL
jgi:hypothetical protein